MPHSCETLLPHCTRSIILKLLFAPPPLTRSSLTRLSYETSAILISTLGNIHYCVDPRTRCKLPEKSQRLGFASGLFNTRSFGFISETSATLSLCFVARRRVALFRRLVDGYVVAQLSTIAIEPLLRQSELVLCGISVKDESTTTSFLRRLSRKRHDLQFSISASRNFFLSRPR